MKIPRYIDADKLKKYVNSISTHWLNEWDTLGVLAAVDKQPTVDAVEVVRCKDCKHSFACFASTKHLGCDIWEAATTIDGFCDEGERREENG